MWRSIFKKGSHASNKKKKDAQLDASEEKKAVDCILEFTVDMIKNLGPTENFRESLIFSPLSVYAALSLAHLGAAGRTQEEIGKVLRSPKDSDKIQKFHEEICTILNLVQNQPHECGGEVKLINGIFVQECLEVKESYLDQLTSFYKTEAIRMNFQNCKETEGKINQWILENTNGRIPQLFHNELSPGTPILLASSLYFIGRWQEGFSVSRTNLETFSTATEEIEVPMMHNEDIVSYVNNQSLQFEAIVLPYIREVFSMGIILPYANQSLVDLTQSLGAVNIKEIFAAKSIPVEYKIPRMKFSSLMSLKATLFMLGMEEIFSSGDFSNMIEDVSASIGNVKHAAEIEVDEDGTKATAISAMKYRFRSIKLVNNPIQFYVNRPFMALIHHQPTSTILFTAVVYKPTYETYL